MQGTLLHADFDFEVLGTGTRNEVLLRDAEDQVKKSYKWRDKLMSVADIHCPSDYHEKFQRLYFYQR